MKLKIITSIFIIISIQQVFSIKLYLADLNIYRSDTNVILTESDKKSDELILKKIKTKDFEGMLQIKKLPDTYTFKNRIIKSSIDASNVCEMLNIDYLLYGFIEKTNKYYNAEIRLFDNTAKEDKKTFYVKIEIGNIEEIINEAADKIIKYMYSILGLTKEQKEREKGFGGIGIYNGIGYWFPLGEWWNITTGIISFESGMNVIPLNHIIKKRNFAFNLKYGFYIEYQLAMSKPGYLQSYLNIIHFRIPVHICFELVNNHTLFIDFSPQLQLDIMYQQKLYDEPEIQSTAAFSLYWGYGYEYWFGSKKLVCIGIKNSFDYTLYDRDFVDIKIQLFTVTRIPYKKKKGAK